MAGVDPQIAAELDSDAEEADRAQVARDYREAAAAGAAGAADGGGQDGPPVEAAGGVGAQPAGGGSAEVVAGGGRGGSGALQEEGEGLPQPTTPRLPSAMPSTANFMPPPDVINEMKGKYKSTLLGIFIYAGVKMPESKAFEEVTGISVREHFSVSLGITASDEEEAIK